MISQLPGSISELFSFDAQPYPLLLGISGAMVSFPGGWVRDGQGARSAVVAGGASARCAALPQSRARRLPAACLPEQMGAVKGESRSRLELPFPFTFPSLSCLKTWVRFNSYLSELPAAADWEQALEVAGVGTSFSHYLRTFILPQ